MLAWATSPLGIYAVGVRIDVDKHRHCIYQQHRTHRARVEALAVGGIVQFGKTRGELTRVPARKELSSQARLRNTSKIRVSSLSENSGQGVKGAQYGEAFHRDPH